MRRTILKTIKSDLGKKIVMICGPRQVGKTTLAKGLSDNIEYLNYDVSSHRPKLIEQSWRRDVELLVFDELHKMPRWKAWLKGIYDGEGLSPPIVVTGSARMDIARKMGDSLAGRHFLFHLLPFDLKELGDYRSIDENFSRLLTVGGFPEPFFSTEESFPGRWRKTHVDLILRQDLIDLEQVRQITQIETLLELLRDRVGSPLSAQSLSEDLGVSDSTVRRWLRILEDLFLIFKVMPWHKNITRSLKKASKYYFYDNGLVRGGNGPALENLVACSLLKEVYHAREISGREIELRYLRNKDGDEIDFAVLENTELSKIIEVKWSDNQLSPAFRKFAASSQKIKSYQIVAQGADQRDSPHGVMVRDAKTFLAKLQL